MVVTVVSVAVVSVTGVMVVMVVTVVAVVVVVVEVINTVDFTHVPQSAGQIALMTSPATGSRQLISAKSAHEAGSRSPLQFAFVVVVPVVVVAVVVVVVVVVVLVVDGTHAAQRTGHVVRTPRTSGSSDNSAITQIASLKLVHSSGSGRPLQTGVWVMTGHESHITGHLALTTPPTTESEQVEGTNSVQS